MTTLIQFYQLAKSKVTTYVALAIAAIAQVAEHAEEAYNSWPQIAAYLPNAKWVVSASHYLLMGLGFLVVYTRVRRLFGKGVSP